MSDWQPLPLPPVLLGESPFWHPEQQALYWCDIDGRALHRWQPVIERHEHWPLPCEAASCAPLPGGELLLAMRDGLWRFDPDTAQRRRLALPPYDPAQERFNDGKADPQGRFWAATIFEPRTAPKAALYRWRRGDIARVAGDITNGNAIAFSPDGGTLLLADTTAHRIDAFDFDGTSGAVSRRRLLIEFARKQDGVPYGGRPDGAAMDSAGCCWVAMYEGARLVRIDVGTGGIVDELPLPVSCPTMPCFGGADLRTLYVTTANRGEPLGGCVLTREVSVPGLPVNFVNA